MKSIEARFREVQDKFDMASSFIVFVRAVEGQKFTKDMISRWFTKLVDKDDYNSDDRQRLVDFCFKRSSAT